jgi:hypothetical protein
VTLGLLKPADSFDGAYWGDLVPANSNSAIAQANLATINLMLANQWRGGTFAFANVVDVTGPVDRPVSLNADDYFIEGGPILFTKKIGGALKGFPARGYVQSTVAFTEDSVGGNISRIIRNDAVATDFHFDGAIIRLRGNGQTVEDLGGIVGRPFAVGAEGPTGTKPRVGIEIEGHSQTMSGTNISAASGWHTIRRCTIVDCYYGVCFRGGFYDANTEAFTVDEGHADCTFISEICFWGCEVVISIQNSQSVGHAFEKLIISGWGGINEVDNMVVFDVQEGGDFTCSGLLSLLYWRLTLFKLTGYSANNANMSVENFKWDPNGAVFLTLIEYAGPTGTANVSTRNYTIDIKNGHYPYDGTQDHLRLFAFPADCRDMPLQNISLKIRGLELIPGFEDKFEPVDGLAWDYQSRTYTGPYRPTDYWLTVAAPAAMWRMDENSGTVVGDGVVKDNSYTTPTADGTITGAGVTKVSGLAAYGDALQFTNTNNTFVEVADQTKLRIAHSSTLSLVFQLNSTANGVVVSKYKNSGFVETGIRLESGGFYITENSTNRFGNLIAYITVGVPCHLLMTLNADLSVGKVYIDGVLRGTEAFANWFNNTSVLRFGSPTADFYGSLSKSADMILDEVRFYDFAMDAAQVALTYQDMGLV